MRHDELFKRFYGHFISHITGKHAIIINHCTGQQLQQVCTKCKWSIGILLLYCNWSGNTDGNQLLYTLLLYIHLTSCVTSLKATTHCSRTKQLQPSKNVPHHHRVANESVKSEDTCSKQLAIVIRHDYIHLNKLHYIRIKAIVNTTC